MLARASRFSEKKSDPGRPAVTHGGQMGRKDSHIARETTSSLSLGRGLGEGPIAATQPLDRMTRYARPWPA